MLSTDLNVPTLLYNSLSCSTISLVVLFISMALFRLVGKLAMPIGGGGVDLSKGLGPN